MVTLLLALLSPSLVVVDVVDPMTTVYFATRLDGDDGDDKDQHRPTQTNLEKDQHTPTTPWRGQDQRQGVGSIELLILLDGFHFISFHFILLATFPPRPVWV